MSKDRVVLVQFYSQYRIYSSCCFHHHNIAISILICIIALLFTKLLLRELDYYIRY